MDRRELGILVALVYVFLFPYFVNFASPKVRRAVFEAFSLLPRYARSHTLACIVPAIFFAGAIAKFLSKE